MSRAAKQVTVRLAAEGGREVRRELKGIGEDGASAFQRLGTEMEAANARADRFFRRLRIAAAAGAAAVATAATAMIRNGLQVIDNQAKLAASLGTTVESMQVLERAAETSGIAFGQLQQGAEQLTRRLSQAAAGTGPAVEALDRLNLSAEELMRQPLDGRIAQVQAALAAYVPEAERAGVASQLFGESAGLAFARLDGDAISAAADDLARFGVVVSEQDAAQIERTNDAISRLGLIWRGLANQLAVAAAPALEAVATAMAALAERSGPLGQAIELVLGNLDRLAALAAALAALMAGRFVAGMAAAAFSVRGLATALAILRGALIRLPFVAIVIATQELILRFGRLVAAAGGFAQALEMLGDVAREIGGRVADAGRWMLAEYLAITNSMEGAVLEWAQAAVEHVVWFADRTVASFDGAFRAAMAIWERLPPALGDLIFTAANNIIAGVERMLQAVADRVNGFLDTINRGLEAVGFERRLSLVGDVSLGEISNRFEGEAADAGRAARDAFDEAFAEQRLQAPELFGELGQAARDRADAFRRMGDELAAGLTAPLESVAAIRDALASTGEAADGTAAAVGRISEAFDAIGGDGDEAGTGGDGGGSAGRAAQAAEAAGDAIAEAGEVASTAWQQVGDSLRDYADRAMDVGSQVSDALVSAFRGAEDALAEMVTKGKISFSDLADSILADITRIALRSAVLGPLANLLGGAFGGGGAPGFSAFNIGGLSVPAPVAHAGGVIGVSALPQRMVPAAAFAGAERFHGGGMAGLRAGSDVAGLRPDEVPAILQRGERVLSRREVAEERRRGGVTVNMTITTPDAGSFKRSEGQIAADMSRAIERARRNR